MKQENLELEERFGHARKRREPSLVIVNDACEIVYESRMNDDFVEFCTEPGQLRPDVSEAVKSLIDTSSGENDASNVAFVGSSHLMRLRRLRGKSHVLFALALEPLRSRDAVQVAVRRYGLTRREHEILMLILEGASAGEIAAALHLSEHTVQGYFKRLLKKTGARNRVAMAANVLEWSPQAKHVPTPGDLRKAAFS